MTNTIIEKNKDRRILDVKFIPSHSSQRVVTVFVRITRERWCELFNVEKNDLGLFSFYIENIIGKTISEFIDIRNEIYKDRRLYY